MRNIKKLKITVKEFYFIFVLVTGLIISLMLPIGQTPDELEHVRCICETFGAQNVYEQYLTVTYTYNIVDSAFTSDKINRDELKEAETIRFDKKSISFEPRIRITIFRYLPAFIGLMIGYLLNLPVATCFWLSEMANLLFATLIGYLALKIMPVKKHMLLAVMLLPMCIQQYSSINYDAVLLPLCFLLIAYVLNLRLASSNVTWKNIAIVVGLMAIIGTIKPPYALIGLMAVTIPYERVNNIVGKILRVFQKKPVVSVIIIIAIVVAALYVLKDLSYISLIAASFVNPVQYIRLIYHSIINNFEMYMVSLVGNFGYMSMSLPLVVILCIYAYLFISALRNRDEACNLKIRERIIYVFISFVIVNMVFIAMISHTFLLYGLEYGPLSSTLASYNMIGQIEGVQGRYFIPLIPLILVCINGVKDINGKIFKIIETLYYITVPVSMIMIIYNYLW